MCTLVGFAKDSSIYTHRLFGNHGDTLLNPNYSGTFSCGLNLKMAPIVVWAAFIEERKFVRGKSIAEDTAYAANKY